MIQYISDGIASLTFYQCLTLLILPVLSYMFRKSKAWVKEQKDRYEILEAKQQEMMASIVIVMSAQQAQMRKTLLDDYWYYKNNGGWISDEHMQEWDNRYQAYHNLGQNGVLDAKREELIHMPNRPTLQIQPVNQTDGGN